MWLRPGAAVLAHHCLNCCYGLYKAPEVTYYAAAAHLLAQLQPMQALSVFVACYAAAADLLRQLQPMQVLNEPKAALWFYRTKVLCPAELGRQTKSGILCSMNKMFYELIYPIHPVLNVLLLVHRTVSFVKPARRLEL